MALKFPKKKTLLISQLMYADDLILFFASPKEYQHIQYTLQKYSQLSRQIINKSKSKVCFSLNTPHQFKRFFRSTLKIRKRL